MNPENMVCFINLVKVFCNLDQQFISCCNSI